jgi:hypothetical protein
MFDDVIAVDPTLEAIAARIEGHPTTSECPDAECLVCGMRDCLHAEPLHYHHDGCPACSEHTEP